MAARQFLFAPSSSISDRSLHWLVLIGVVGSAGLVLMAVVSLGLLREFAILLAVLAAAWAAWRWPVTAAVFLVAFTSVNRFLIFLLYSWTGSVLLLRAAQLWKDGLVLILLARVIHEALERRRAPRVYFLDLLVIMFLMLNALYVIYPGTLPDNNLLGRVLGFRLDAYFLFAYFVGRGLTLKREHVRWLVLALIPGSIAVAVVAAWQWIWPGQSNDFLNSLGFQEFVKAVGGSNNIAVRTRDLAGVAIPRASSLLMGDLALSFYQLLVVPFAAALLFIHGKTIRPLVAALFLLLMIGTVLMAGTRSVIAAVPIALGVLTFWSVSYGRAIATGVVVLAVSVVVLFMFTGLTGDWFDALLSQGEGSTQAHQHAVEDSIRIVQEEPLGRGLGTSHTVGFQLKLRSSFANESWYLQLATEIGIAGVALYSLTMLMATAAPLVSYLRVRDRWLRVLTLGAGGASIGFLLVGLVLHVWEAPVIAAAFWLLVGIAVRAPQLEKEWESASPQMP